MSYPLLPPERDYPHLPQQQASRNEKHQAYTDFHDGHPGKKAAETNRPLVARTHIGPTTDNRNNPVISRHTDTWGGHYFSSNERYKIEQRYNAAVARYGPNGTAARLLKYHLDHWDDKQKK
jgi:hypothetical protein